MRASYDAKPYRRIMMETFGGTVHPSPSDLTEAGRTILAERPRLPGSLGIAISEAVEVAAQDPTANYALGSVLNHVLLHQTIIGEEALLQLAKVGESVDLIVGCTGGGSNFGGLAFPFLREKLRRRRPDRSIRAVEPASCPSLTRGAYAYDFGDTAGFTPLMKMHTLGHDFIPDPIHAGGLRYHGMSPLISHVYELGLMEAVATRQTECFAAGRAFARTEGIVPAPEPTHALAAAIGEAMACKETGEEKVILTALCGHGQLDLAAYDAYLGGTWSTTPGRRPRCLRPWPRRCAGCPASRADRAGRGRRAGRPRAARLYLRATRKKRYRTVEAGRHSMANGLPAAALPAELAARSEGPPRWAEVSWSPCDRPSGTPDAGALVYLHGGAFVNGIQPQHWTLRVAKWPTPRTGRCTSRAIRWRPRPTSPTHTPSSTRCTSAVHPRRRSTSWATRPAVPSR